VPVQTGYLGEYMKIRIAIASLAVMGALAAAIAQPTPPTPAPAAAAPPPGPGRGGPPAPPPFEFPVGGTDNLSDGDYVIGPEYRPARESTLIHANATGTKHELIMRAEDSKIYPGRKRKPGYVADPARSPGGRGNAVPGDVQWVDAPYEPRHVWVYLPGGYKKGTPLPFIIVTDGRGHQDRFHRVLDNLIAEKKIPPMAMVALQPGSVPKGANATEDAQGSQRGYEYDTMSGQYSDFIETEVLPFVTRELGVAFTKDPEGRATFGGSSGAAAAFSMAWYHPERYRRTILYSPTFVNQQSPYDPKTPRGAWEYHATLIPNSPRKPIRIWMQTGELDNRYMDPEDTWHNWVMAANRTAAVLKAKGYNYRYAFSKEGRHVDPRVLDQTLAAAMEYVWQDYKP